MKGQFWKGDRISFSPSFMHNGHRRYATGNVAALHWLQWMRSETWKEARMNAFLYKNVKAKKRRRQPTTWTVWTHSDRRSGRIRSDRSFIGYVCVCVFCGEKSGRRRTKPSWIVSGNGKRNVRVWNGFNHKRSGSGRIKFVFRVAGGFLRKVRNARGTLFHYLRFIP